MRRYRFGAARHLPKLPDGHMCRRIHGHAFVVEVTVVGPVGDESGLLVDFAELDDAMRPLLGQLEHHYLNEVAGLENPTTERLAGWIWDRLAPKVPLLAAVAVEESADARVTYRGGR